MYRIINSLAVAEYNKALRVVEVNFNGQGSSELYHETMDIAMNISMIYETNSWLFIKDDFKDISHNAFMAFAKKWSNKASEMHGISTPDSLCKVALLTTVESYFYLLDEFEWLEDSRKNLNNLHFKLFNCLEQAKVFLSNDYSSRVTIES